MKYIAFIGLGLVILATMLYAVLWANMPTGKLAVHPVMPMGANFTYPHASMAVEPRRAWQFAITNAGRAPATWFAYVHFKDGNHEWADPSAWNFDPKGGVLSNGQSATIKVGVPPCPGTNWAVTVKYWPVWTPLETKLNSWLKPVPQLRRLLPNDGEHFAASGWYSGTNITIAH
jgi:hypothetical protein